jgi:sugar phosphate isomerase/epimerase
MTDFSFQLYSARNHPPLADNLTLLAALGYTQVEGYDGVFSNVEPTDLRRQLDALGMAMPTTHVGLESLEDTDATRALAETLGVEVIYCPVVASDQRSQPDDGWRALADKLARLGEIYAGSGLGLGWHNHDYEFKRTTTGAVPLDLILEGAPELQWEADLGWVSKAGEDPAAWLDRYAGRVTAVHIKDIARPGEALDEDGWADVGHGTMEWETLMAAVTAGTGCRYFVLEHDKPSDAGRFAERSIRALRKMGY